MTKYTTLLNDISFDESQKFFRRCAETAYDAISDNVEDFALNLANQYFPDMTEEQLESDEFVEGFINPLLDKIIDAVKANL